MPTGGKGKGEVSALLQDASLAHKKVDALLEAEQKNKATENNVDIEGPQTQFVDRLYHSLAKLKHLEKSRNRMNLCADSMEVRISIFPLHTPHPTIFAFIALSFSFYLFGCPQAC